MITPIINTAVAMSTANIRNINITRNVVSSRYNIYRKPHINNTQQLNKSKSEQKHNNIMGEFIEIEIYRCVGPNGGYYSKTNININLIEEFYINNVDFMGKLIKDKSKWHYIIYFNGSKKEINKESYDKLVNIFYSENKNI